jgi:hypothetical protein
MYAKPATLDRHRKHQRDPQWQTHYRNARPRLERKRER